MVRETSLLFDIEDLFPEVTTNEREFGDAMAELGGASGRLDVERDDGRIGKQHVRCWAHDGSMSPQFGHWDTVCQRDK